MDSVGATVRITVARAIAICTGPHEVRVIGSIIIVGHDRMGTWRAATSMTASDETKGGNYENYCDDETTKTKFMHCSNLSIASKILSAKSSELSSS